MKKCWPSEQRIMPDPVELKERRHRQQKLGLTRREFRRERRRVLALHRRARVLNRRLRKARDIVKNHSPRSRLWFYDSQELECRQQEVASEIANRESRMRGLKREIEALGGGPAIIGKSVADWMRELSGVILVLAATLVAAAVFFPGVADFVARAINS